MISLSSFAQLTINQSIVTQPPYKVGDTITIKYTVDRGLNPVTTPRYFWLRYQFNNKALTYVSTTFSQGSSVQTFYTGWNNYKFTPSQSVDVKSLYGQYQSNPWSYTQNPDWNVAQLTVQRADSPIDGILATQKYIIKDQNTYNSIHKLDLAYSINSDGGFISPITTSSDGVNLTNVTGNTSQFKVRVLFPQGYPITDHRIQLMKLKTDGSNTIDWTQQPILTSDLDASGEATFTSGIKVGDSFGVFVSASFQKPWMNNILTVSDAYKSFLGHSQTDISGGLTFFTFPGLEKNIGNITIGDNVFNESDSYYLFAHIMGQNVSSKAMIPSSTSTSVKYNSGLLTQDWLDGTPKNNVTVTSPIQEVNAVFAWGGDLDWSHSSSPTEISSRLGSVTAMGKNVMLKTVKTVSNSYVPPVLETVKLNVVSKLENGKVILTTSLSKSELAGLEIIMNYDNTKLSLDNVVFDSGSTITNFTTDNDGRLTFGSIDQTKTSRIKVGTPYKLIFTPKTPLTNTSGLFYFVLSDAVDGLGKKINLIVE
jgi:hypothetical protein